MSNVIYSVDQGLYKKGLTTEETLKQSASRLSAARDVTATEILIAHQHIASAYSEICQNTSTYARIY